MTDRSVTPDRFEPIEQSEIKKGATIRAQFNDDKKYQTVVYVATHDGDAYGAPARKGIYAVRIGVDHTKEPHTSDDQSLCGCPSCRHYQSVNDGTHDPETCPWVEAHR